MAYNAGRSPFGDKQSSSLVFEEFVPPSAWTKDATCHYLLVDLPGFKKHELKLQVDDRTHIIVRGERQVRENKYKRFEQRLELPKDADIEKITGKLDGEILYISVPKKVEQVHNKIKHGGIPAPPPAASNEDEADNDQKSDTSDSDDEQKHKHKHKKSESDSDSDANNKKSDAYESEESDNKDDEKDQERMKHRTGFDDNWGQEAEFFPRLAMKKLRKNKKIVATAIFTFTLGVFVSQKFQSNGN